MEDRIDVNLGGGQFVYHPLLLSRKRSKADGGVWWFLNKGTCIGVVTKGQNIRKKTFLFFRVNLFFSCA